MFNSSNNVVTSLTNSLNVSPASSRVRFRWATAKIKRFALQSKYNKRVPQKLDADYMVSAFQEAIQEMIKTEAIIPGVAGAGKVMGKARLPMHIMVAKYARLHWYNALLHFHEKAKRLPTDAELRAALSGVQRMACHPEIEGGLELAVSRLLEKFPMIRNKVRADELERAKRASANVIAVANAKAIAIANAIAALTKGSV